MLSGPAGGRRRHPLPSTGRCSGGRAGSRPAVPGAGGAPGTGWGGVLSRSVAKARIAPKLRKRNVDIPRFFSRPIPARSAFATDLDKRRRRGPPGRGRRPSDGHREAGTTADPRSGGDGGPGGRRRVGLRPLARGAGLWVVRSGEGAGLRPLARGAGLWVVRSGEGAGLRPLARGCGVTGGSWERGDWATAARARGRGTRRAVWWRPPPGRRAGRRPGCPRADRPS